MKHSTPAAPSNPANDAIHALPFVSILTVNFNGKRFLEDFFGSLEQLNYPRDRFEVLFVDNASSDDSVETVSRRWPWARVIRSPKNLGFAGGNNLGFGSARGEFVVLLNNDTRVDPEWLTGLVRTAMIDASVGAVTSKILFMDKPKEINNVGLNLYISGEGGDRGFHEPDDGRYDRVEEVFGGCGASVLLKRTMLDDVGVFDESFFMYYEDLDLAWRARLRGWKCLYTPESVVYHVHCGSSKEWSPFFTFHVERNMIFTNIKNGARGAVYRALKTFALKTLSRAWRLLRRRETDWATMGAYIRAWASLFFRLPVLLAKRVMIRRVSRKMADAEIQRFVVDNRL